jgi:anaerobic selenocysteine-containing dehydrogenase
MNAGAVRPSFCRVCNSNCGILVRVEDGRVARVSGDPAHPVSAGYTCVKGRAQPELLAHPDRLLCSRKRVGSEFIDIDVEQAMDEIAGQLARIRDRYGARAIASYLGTFISANHVTAPLIDSFMRELGSPMAFTPIPIDKPGKEIARALHGTWQAPAQGFDRPDVCLLVGANPFVSYTGFPFGNPRHWLKEQTDRGMRLIVIDPRLTPVARRAFIHLQPRPGHDPAILAAMIRVLLAEDLLDAQFVAEHAAGLDALRAAVAPFDPATVAAAADVPAADLVLAARTWSGRRGWAFAGTGPSMSSSSTLCEYLILALTTLTGKWLREGELVRNPRTLLPPLVPRAQVNPPRPARAGPPMRVRGLRGSAAGMPTAALPEEILLPGEGQVRALISCAGNPVAAFPDQRATVAAMRALDLLVQIDPWMSATARLAHYVIAPRLALETPGVSLMYDYDAAQGVAGGPVDAAAHYTAAIADPPQGSQLIDEWEFYLGLARRLGLQLSVGGGLFGGAVRTPLDMTEQPTTDEMLDLICAGSRVPLAEVRRYPGGAAFPQPAIRVGPPEGPRRRFQLADPDMISDLSAVAAGLNVPRDDRGLRLICRRMDHVRNSSVNVASTHRGRPYNPAFLHPDDLAARGLRAGDVVRLVAARDQITCVVDADPSLRRGLVSMAHAFGGLPEEDDRFRELGSSTSRLLAADADFERYSGQPRMSAIPVEIEPVPVEIEPVPVETDPASTIAQTT